MTPRHRTAVATAASPPATAATVRARTLAWALAAALLLPRLVAAQEFSGVYTDAATKDLGEVLKLDALKGVKVRGWTEGFYEYSFNRARSDVVNSNQGASIVKASDLTIEGRTFDVRANTFAWDLTEVEVEKVPTLGSVGFKVDIAFGSTQDIMLDSYRAGFATGVGDFDRNIQHASIGYVAPVGNGLRLDVGKFVTHIGGEAIEGIKNRNLSRGYLFTYAIPFHDSGIRANYAWSPKLYTELYLLNAWNYTTDNNSAKSVGVTFGITPTSKLAMYVNYLGGPERNDNNRDMRHLGDAQIVFSPTPTLTTMLALDIATDRNALGDGEDASWGGAALFVRKNVAGRFFPSGRVEFYNDQDGFTTGVAQRVWSYTVTGDYKLGAATSFTHLLVRPEVRLDRSDALFFTKERDFRSEKSQLTAGVGLIAYF